MDNEDQVPICSRSMSFDLLFMFIVLLVYDSQSSIPMKIYKNLTVFCLHVSMTVEILRVLH